MIFEKILAEDIYNVEEPQEMYTKEDLVGLIDSMSPEEVDDLGTFIMAYLTQGDDGEFEEPEEVEELDEKEYFDTKKVQIKHAKNIDKSKKRLKAIDLKKYYRKNKSRIQRLASKYRKRAKRNPDRVVTHRN